MCPSDRRRRGALAEEDFLSTTLLGTRVDAGVGVPEEEAHDYNEGVRRGGTLVLVRSEDNNAHSVADILGDTAPAIVTMPIQRDPTNHLGGISLRAGVAILGA